MKSSLSQGSVDSIPDPISKSEVLDQAKREEFALLVLKEIVEVGLESSVRVRYQEADDVEFVSMLLPAYVSFS